eukprot:1519638-Ditylum_brightwellii.AAC.1
MLVCHWPAIGHYLRVTRKQPKPDQEPTKISVTNQLAQPHGRTQFRTGQIGFQQNRIQHYDMRHQGAMTSTSKGKSGVGVLGTQLHGLVVEAHVPQSPPT